MMLLCVEVTRERYRGDEDTGCATTSPAGEVGACKFNPPCTREPNGSPPRRPPISRQVEGNTQYFQHEAASQIV